MPDSTRPYRRLPTPFETWHGTGWRQVHVVAYRSHSRHGEPALRWRLVARDGTELEPRQLDTAGKPYRSYASYLDACHYCAARADLLDRRGVEPDVLHWRLWRPAGAISLAA